MVTGTNARAGVPKVIVLMTDGVQSVRCGKGSWSYSTPVCDDTAIAAALSVKATGTKLVAIGFGDANQLTLSSIASSPSTSFAVYGATASSIVDTLRDGAFDICRVAADLPRGPPPSPPPPPLTPANTCDANSQVTVPDHSSGQATVMTASAGCAMDASITGLRNAALPTSGKPYNLQFCTQVSGTALSYPRCLTQCSMSEHTRISSCVETCASGFFCCASIGATCIRNGVSCPACPDCASTTDTGSGESFVFPTNTGVRDCYHFSPPSPPTPPPLAPPVDCDYCSSLYSAYEAKATEVKNEGACPSEAIPHIDASGNTICKLWVDGRMWSVPRE